MTTLSIIHCHDLPLTLTLTCEGNTSALELVLENTLNRPLVDWCLHLDLPRDVIAGEATLLSRVGSHLQLKPADAQELEAGASCTLQLRGAPQLLQRLSDLPSGCFVSFGGNTVPVRLVNHNLATAPAKAGEQSTQRPTPENAVVLPLPLDMTEARGTRPWPEIPTVAAIADALPAIDWLQRMLGRNWRTSQDKAEAEILCELDSSLDGEAYRLDINHHQVSLFASAQAGFNRGAATLLQILESDPQRCTLPCLQIHDAPRYAFRGLMLDCARHYHSVETILDLLDLMALYKLNHFHWHLTDDEAWRLEIQSFPQLTQIGAWRGHFETLPPQLGSGPNRYGGCYNREDVRRVVEHAATVGIVVIPEIDIPGHCRACIQSLPELLQEPADSSRYVSVQFFNDNVLNPGLPGTYQFLEKVLEEVCEMFPGPFVHLGADEVPKGAWTESPACRELVEREGYGDEKDLQSHLLRHAQQFLTARNKHMMGWEEAAQGDKLAPDTPICAWTGDRAVMELHSSGFPVVSCPAQHAYLDIAWSDDPNEPGLHWAGTADLQTWYEHPPFPSQIVDGLGVQANLWSELITSRKQLEYMLFPRVLATAEWGWSSNAGKNWLGFRSRVEAQLDHLRRRGISPRPLGPED